MKNIVFIIFSSFLLLITFSLKGIYHPGEIIFTDEYAHHDKLTEGDLKQQFDLLDNIYFWVELEKPLAETYDELNLVYDYSNDEYTFNYALRFYINDDLKSRWIFEMPVDEFNHATEIDVVLNSSDYNLKKRFGYSVNYWIDLISELKGGVYEIKIEFVPLNVSNIDSNPSPLATGIFQLTVNPSDMKKFINEKSLLLPEPTIINTKLEKQVIDATENLFKNLVPVKAIITDVNRDWSYSVDDLGNIQRRYLIASFVLKNTLDGSCIVRSGVFFQKHKGYGIFGDLFYLKPATGYFDYPVPCGLTQLE